MNHHAGAGSHWVHEAQRRPHLQQNQIIGSLDIHYISSSPSYQAPILLSSLRIPLKSAQLSFPPVHLRHLQPLQPCVLFPRPLSRTRERWWHGVSILWTVFRLPKVDANLKAESEKATPMRFRSSTTQDVRSGFCSHCNPMASSLLPRILVPLQTTHASACVNELHNARDISRDCSPPLALIYH